MATKDDAVSAYYTQLTEVSLSSEKFEETVARIKVLNADD